MFNTGARQGTRCRVSAIENVDFAAAFGFGCRRVPVVSPELALAEQLLAMNLNICGGGSWPELVINWYHIFVQCPCDCMGIDRFAGRWQSPPGFCLPFGDFATRPAGVAQPESLGNERGCFVIDNNLN